MRCTPRWLMAPSPGPDSTCASTSRRGTTASKPSRTWCSRPTSPAPPRRHRRSVRKWSCAASCKQLAASSRTACSTQRCGTTAAREGRSVSNGLELGRRICQIVASQTAWRLSDPAHDRKGVVELANLIVVLDIDAPGRRGDRSRADDHWGNLVEAKVIKEHHSATEEDQAGWTDERLRGPAGRRV